MDRKTVCITGASRGIGKAIAEGFAARGYDLVLTCRENAALLGELKDSLEQSFGISCITYTGDLSVSANVDALFSLIPQRLDVLVNNAGISYRGLLTDMTDLQWETILNTNVSASFYTCRAAVPRMLHLHAGKILNISSVWGCVGASCEVAYSATKGALNAFTQALAKELAPSNIQVNAIACGAIDTEMNRFLSDEERRMLTDEIPAGRFGTVREAAELAVSLCEGHSYLTGQVIRLDGGWI